MRLLSRRGQDVQQLLRTRCEQRQPAEEEGGRLEEERWAAGLCRGAGQVPESKGGWASLAARGLSCWWEGVCGRSWEVEGARRPTGARGGGGDGTGPPMSSEAPDGAAGYGVPGRQG